MPDLGETERSENTQPDGRGELLVLTAALPGQSTRWPLRERLVLGRGDSCTHVLEASRVSRRHVEIRRQGPVVVLRDLDSTNGTYLDGRRVEHAALRPGAVLRIGDWLGVVEQCAEGEIGVSFGEPAPGLLGGLAISRAFSPLARGAASDLPIILVGETGSGKERFAAAAHACSGRAGPFHAINCAGIAPSLAEAELFGQARGAFTGAHRSTTGHLRAAHGGTLFLDELAELPLPVQAKLLRAVETRAVTPLGETEAVAVDIRLVAALQRPPRELVERGVLRQDLAARLSGIVTYIPPLRERAADVPSLFHHFVERLGKRPGMSISTKLQECLCLHSWPNNVRELELLAKRLVAIHGDEPVLRRSHLPDELREGRLGPPEQRQSPSFDSRNEQDKHRLTQALRENAGNLKRSAAAVGISRQRAYRLLGAADGAQGDPDKDPDLDG